MKLSFIVAAFLIVSASSMAAPCTERQLKAGWTTQDLNASGYFTDGKPRIECVAPKQENTCLKMIDANGEKSLVCTD